MIKTLGFTEYKMLHGIKFSIHGIYYSRGLWNSTKQKDFAREKSEK
jgi:hypothetical protein